MQFRSLFRFLMINTNYLLISIHIVNLLSILIKAIDYAISYRLSTTHYIDWSERWGLWREQHVLKDPQERSDEEIEAVPAERVHL